MHAHKRFALLTLWASIAALLLWLITAPAGYFAYTVQWLQHLRSEEHTSELQSH